MEIIGIKYFVGIRVDNELEFSFSKVLNKLAAVLKINKYDVLDELAHYSRSSYDRVSSGIDSGKGLLNCVLENGEELRDILSKKTLRENKDITEVIDYIADSFKKMNVVCSSSSELLSEEILSSIKQVNDLLNFDSSEDDNAIGSRREMREGLRTVYKHLLFSIYRSADEISEIKIDFLCAILQLCLVFFLRHGKVEQDDFSRMYFNTNAKVKQYFESKNNPEIQNGSFGISRQMLYEVSISWMKKNWDDFSYFDPDLISTAVSSSFEPSSNAIEQCGSASLTNAKELITQSQEHLFLIGEGGIGKTTLLFSLMNEVAATSRAFFYIDLSHAPTSAKCYEKIPCFIQRSLGYQLYKHACCRAGVLNAEYNEEQFLTAELSDKFFETNIKPLRSLFESSADSSSNTPEFTLLLDGLNEVSRAFIPGCDGNAAIDFVIKEIEQLSNKERFSNLRIVLTGRSDHTQLENLKRYHLQGVSQTTAKKYMRKKGIEETDIECALREPQLWSVLKNPLFLIIYSNLTHRTGLCTRGEILHQWFHVRSENYSIQNRLLELRQNRTLGSTSAVNTNQQLFLLHFLLPEIAWEMEKQQVFALPINLPGNQLSLRSIIERFLSMCCDQHSIWNTYGDEYFRIFVSGSQEVTMGLVIKEIMNSSINSSGYTQVLIDSAVSSLGIMHGKERRYGFRHHYFRDYFAAMRVINRLSLAVAYFEASNDSNDRESSLSCLRDIGTISLPVKRFIGEILGEHHNKPVFHDGQWHYPIPAAKNKRTLLTRAIDMFRQTNEENSMCLCSVIEIIKQCRMDLAGMDFSLLDLSEVDLSDVPLRHMGCESNFAGTLISDYTFIRGRHDAVYALCYSPNDEYVASLYEDGELIIWDMTSQIKICSKHIERINRDVTLRWVKDTIVVVNPLGAGQKLCWKPFVDGQESTEVMLDETQYEIIKSVPTFQADNRKFFSLPLHPETDDYIVYFRKMDYGVGRITDVFRMNTANGSIEWSVEGYYACIALSPSGKYIGLVTGKLSGTTTIIDTQTGVCIASWKNCAAENIGWLDEDTFYLINWEGTISLYETTHWSRVKSINSVRPKCVCLSSNKHTLCVGEMNGGIVCLSNVQNIPIFLIKGNEDPIKAVFVSPNGEKVFFMGTKIGYIFSLKEGKIHRIIELKQHSSDYCWSPNGEQIACICRDNDSEKLLVYSIDAEDEWLLPKSYSIPALKNDYEKHQLIWHSNSKKIVVLTIRESSIDNDVLFGTIDVLFSTIIDLANGQRNHYRNMESGTSFEKCCVSPDGNLMAFCISDIMGDKLAVFDFKQRVTIAGPRAGLITSVEWLNDTTIMYCDHYDHYIHLWNVSSLEESSFSLDDPNAYNEKVKLKTCIKQVDLPSLKGKLLGDFYALEIIDRDNGEKKTYCFLTNLKMQYCNQTELDTSVKRMLFTIGKDQYAVFSSSFLQGSTLIDVDTGKVICLDSEELNGVRRKVAAGNDEVILYSTERITFLNTNLEIRDSIDLISGLHYVKGCDFSRINPKSKISDDGRKVLHQYGAIIHLNF